MTHDLPHAATCDVLPDGMTLAHDGLSVTVDETMGDEALDAAARSVSAMH